MRSRLFLYPRFRRTHHVACADLSLSGVAALLSHSSAASSLNSLPASAAAPLSVATLHNQSAGLLVMPEMSVTLQMCSISRATRKVSAIVLLASKKPAVGNQASISLADVVQTRAILKCSPSP